MKKMLARAVIATALGACLSTATHAAADEERRLAELRNTIGNLLQALVERGVISREQAEAMVTSAQSKAEADAAAELAARAEEEKADEGAVRVPYVPEIVKEEIRKQVLSEITPAVTKQAIEEAQSSDALARALPDWVRRIKVVGDVRVRGQGDTYAEDNQFNYYLDPLLVNDRGGRTRAGTGARINVSEDRQRLRARLRLGVESELGYGWSAGTRIATGTLRDAVSTNQTLGSYGGRFTIGVDQAWLRWTGQSDTGRQSLAVTGGRMANPWYSTDLVWDQDLAFDGVSTAYRYSISRDEPYARNFFATAGAFPLQEVELSNKDKWLFGGQVGVDWRTLAGGRFRFGAAYYDFRHISGVRNTVNDTDADFTAPVFMQRGNTLFNIRNNPGDLTQELFALGSEFQVLDVTASMDWRIGSLHRLSLTGGYVDNVGYDEVFGPGDLVLRYKESDEAIDARARTKGYLAEVGFGSQRPAERGGWRASLAYRYLERDAVVDAFTDSDFRLGGTDVQGYILNLDYSFSPKMLARLRYLSASEIDGAPLGIDVLQFDFNATF
jgi:hypothetical protein